MLHLEQTIREYLNFNNAKPKPFVWSKNTEDILASVERFCLQTSNSRVVLSCVLCQQNVHFL